MMENQNTTIQKLVEKITSDCASADEYRKERDEQTCRVRAARLARKLRERHEGKANGQPIETKSVEPPLSPAANTRIGNGESATDWKLIEGNWTQLKGKVKERWGMLTDDDLDEIAGRRGQLEGKLQERYGLENDRIRRDIDDWYGRQR